MQSSSQLRPAVTAYLLAPLLAELLTGSRPPLTFFHPAALLLLTTLYGCGVLVVHELALRWRRGWPGLVLLGVAFAVVAEGLMTKSCFSPDWSDLGLLGHYGRWLGVNWIWAICLLVFHPLMSITAPLLITELVYPASRGRRWLDDAALQMLGGGLLAAVVYGALTGGAHAGAGPYAGGVVVTAALVWAAWRWRPAPLPAGTTRRPWVVGAQAAATVLALLWLMQRAPDSKLPSLVWFLAIAFVVRWRLRCLARLVAAGWSDRHSLALVTGLCSVWLVLAPLQEWQPGRADDPSGMRLVAVVGVLGLGWLRRRVSAGSASAPAADSG